uniref:Uncharacterized protein n=1 Tax=Cacopsylla melanoneura TaxID=428564 RepID=A0A8D8XIF6_9HEMI
MGQCLLLVMRQWSILSTTCPLSSDLPKYDGFILMVWSSTSKFTYLSYLYLTVAYLDLWRPQPSHFSSFIVFCSMLCFVVVNFFQYSDLVKPILHEQPFPFH